MKIRRSQPACWQHEQTRCSLRIIGNALDMKALQKELLGYGVIANGPNVPQVHQSCVRTDLSTVRQQGSLLGTRLPVTKRSI